MALRWLAEIVQPSTRQPAEAGPMATAVRRIGAKLALALQLDQVEVVGVDMINAAMNELLAAHALPQAASLRIAGREADGFAEGIVAGIARACRAHDLPITVQLAVEANDEDVGITLSGIVQSAPRFEPVPGDVVLALRGTGPSDHDHEVLLEATLGRCMSFDTRLPNGQTLGEALIAPRASHDAVLHDPVRLGWPFAATPVDRGGLMERVRALLPESLAVRFDLSALQPLSPFPECSAANADECSLGHDFVVVVHANDATQFESHFAAWGEPATRIGVVVARDEPAT